MKPFLDRFAGLALSFWLIACTALPSHSQERDTFPGGSPYYSCGVSQSKENFANIEVAQYHLGLYSKQITWRQMRAELAPGAFTQQSPI